MEAPTRHHNILRLKLDVDLRRRDVFIGDHKVGTCGIGWEQGLIKIHCAMQRYEIDRALDATIGPDYKDAWTKEYRP